MYKEMLKELRMYLDELEYIGCGERTVDDIVKYLESKKYSESTIGRHIKVLKDEGTSWVIKKDDNLMLNKEQMAELIEYLQSIIRKNDLSFGPCVTSESLNQVKTRKTELVQQKKKLELAVEERDAKIAKLNEKVKQLEIQEKAALEEVNKLKAENITISLKKPILILESEKITPCEDSFEKQFVPTNKLDENSEEKVLNEKNYIRKKIQKIFNNDFLTNKLRRILSKANKSKFETDKVYVKNILESGCYTNQEKLALYAAFSDYRHTDMERLLNFAGDCNINADLVIKWAESLGDKVDYLQLKNSLRQFAKPTEYQMKYELARELLLGEWIVEFELNDETTRFVLVSEKDIETVRDVLKLPSTSFSYEKLIEKKDKEEKRDMLQKKETEEKKVITKKPSFVHRYNINDEFENFDFPDVAVSIDDIEQEEG